MITDKTMENSIWNSVNNYLIEARPDERGWEGTFESLKSMIFKSVEEDEREIQQKVKYFEKSIEDLKNRFSSNLSNFQEINMEIWLGQNFEKFGAWEKALSYYEKALNLCDDDSQDTLKSMTILNMGHIHMMRNNWDEALVSYQESLKLCQRNGDQTGEAKAYNGIGIIYFEQGAFAESSGYWEKGLELAEQLNESKLNAKLCTNLGALMSTQGNWEKALGYHNKAATLFEQIGDHRGLAETYHNMGMTYADMDRLPDSNTYYEKSFDIAKGIGDVRLQALVKLNRVELYMAINDTYAGLAFSNQALQTFLQLSDHLGEAETYKFLGALYTRLKKWDLASPYFDQSIFLANKYKNPLLEAEAHLEYGLMHKQKDDKEFAATHLNEALTIFENLKAENDIVRVKELLSSIKP
ncbi:tetratricopeptide repeat protein [candidate division KSB1 bacterium]|nr:tetratricopeptide repeat protein [candidate division KSB1 bacterium]